MIVSDKDRAQKSTGMREYRGVQRKCVYMTDIWKMIERVGICRSMNLEQVYGKLLFLFVCLKERENFFFVTF